MPLICIIVISVMFYGGVSKDQASRVFGNMKYHVDNAFNEDQENVTLVNGIYEEREFRLEYDHRYVYYDFNHDGLQDAAVMLTQNNGGNQDWYTLVFLINDGKQLVHRATIDLDDRAIIYSMRAKNGKVYLDMNVHQPGDYNGGPSKHLREWYEYPGPNVFTGRMGSYIWGESMEGVRGISDKNFKSLPSSPPGYNQGFVNGLSPDEWSRFEPPTVTRID